MPILVSLALFVASYLISALMVKRQKVKPASLEEFEFPQFEEGTPQPVLFGDAWTGGWFVLWYGNYRTRKIKTKGKK